MVKTQRWQNLKEGEALVLPDEHRSKSRPVFVAFISLLSCCVILAPLLLFSFPAFTLSRPHSRTFKVDPEPEPVTSGTIYCDRSSSRFDVCSLTGDIRTDSVSSSIFLYQNGDDIKHGNEKIRPYPRKWETDLMIKTVSELNLIVKNHSLSSTEHKCDVKHPVPAVFFSNGGNSGNAYHDMNDVILPIYIACQKFDRKVVLVVLDYHEWWVEKYHHVLSRLSDYPVIDFTGDKRTHCFPESIVGLKVHNELSVDPSLMEDNKTIVDFHNLLDRAFRPRVRVVRGLVHEENGEKMAKKRQNPRLAIISRDGPRKIINENALVIMAERIGFSVTVLRPETMELARIYMVLSSSDVLLGVHGAGLTYFLFMKPGSVLIQIIPLGVDWPAGFCFGEPSVKFGLRYIGYQILAKESSLYHEYDKNDPVLTNPQTIISGKWDVIQNIYLHQYVRLNLPRFRQILIQEYQYTIGSKRH